MHAPQLAGSVAVSTQVAPHVVHGMVVVPVPVLLCAVLASGGIPPPEVAPPLAVAALLPAVAPP